MATWTSRIERERARERKREGERDMYICMYMHLSLCVYIYTHLQRQRETPTGALPEWLVLAGQTCWWPVGAVAPWLPMMLKKQRPTWKRRLAIRPFESPGLGDICFAASNPAMSGVQ